jgi:hypothetical protein
MLFARAEVGRWHREAKGKKLISKYEAVKKWDYLDSMGSRPIDAVTSSHFEKYIMFIRNDVSFLLNIEILFPFVTFGVKNSSKSVHTPLI